MTKSFNESGASAGGGGANEPSTPGKGSERPLNDDQPLRPGEKVESSTRKSPQRPRPESPGGAGDMKRIE